MQTFGHFLQNKIEFYLFNTNNPQKLDICKFAYGFSCIYRFFFVILRQNSANTMKRLLFMALVCAVSMTSMEAKTLVAYFSATGTTKAAAEKLAKQHDARLWEIVPAQPYTDADLDWRDVTPYDTVYVGFPIWWGICPRIINSWLDNNEPQLQGKIMIPFATSGSSGIEEAVAYLKKTYPTLKWQKGLLLNKR